MHSFDIFDTLITRSTATPTGIFMLMQEVIQENNKYDPFLTANFYELRIGAEELSRKYTCLKRQQEITLGEIYETLAMTVCISEVQRKELMKLEVEMECNNVIGITKNITLLKKLKEQGEQVVLISDMYLNESILRRMLCLVDPVFKELPIYVSSAYGKTKGSGELFKIVQRQEHAVFSNWTHYGDNEYVDIKAAAKLGIKAVHLLPETLKEYEQYERDFYHQLSIGSSRYVRSLRNGSTASEVGASLAGPILYPYVSWFLKESMKEGINRLYFVARDGWLLWQMANVIIQIKKYPIKTSYIYGSRTAWRLPYYNGSKEDLDKIFYYSNMEEILSLNDLAKLFQLPLEELKDFLPEKLKNIKGEQPICKVEVDTISKWLLENEKFRTYLVQSQIENKYLIIRYLQQEIDTSDNRFAFVELSGTGFTQQCLFKIIRNFYTGEIRNFFYRLDDIQEEEQCKFIQFYPSNLKRYMLELLCRAPHGQTEGYREKNGKILPILQETEGIQLKTYHIEEYRDAVLAYVKYMEHSYMQNEIAYVQKLNIVREYMELISNHPPKRISEYFCHMPFSSGGRKNSMVEFAPPVSKKQLRNIYFWNNGQNIRQIYQGDFILYALVASEKAEKYKEKCQRYRKSGIGKWLVDCNQYLRTHQKPGLEFSCPWEFFYGNIVIYGAGKVGRSLVKQAKQKYAKCNNLLWVDSNFMELQIAGVDVKSPEEIIDYSFDRVIIAIHNIRTRKEIWDKLREMGIEAEKIYYG